MEAEIKILILEDELSDLELLVLQLEKTKIPFKHMHVENEKGFRKGLTEFKPDLILSDYSLPQFTGMEALKIVKEVSPLTPFIIITGTLNEEIAVNCIKEGAVDYLLKDNLVRLGSAIGGALEKKALAANKIKVEQDLRESEEFNRRIIESSNDCIRLLDFDGNLLFMSKGGQRLQEIDDIAPLLNKSWLDYWQGADRKTVVTAIEQAKKGNIGSFQGYSPTMKGTPKWWDVSVAPVTDSAGKIKSLMAVSRDITDRKIFELERREIQKKYQNFFELNPLGVCTVNTDGVILHCNRALEKILGYTHKELLKKRLIDLTHPDDLAISVNFHREIVKGSRENIIFEKRYITKIGETIWAVLTAISFRDSQQNLRINLVVEDITERRQAEEMLKESELKFRLIWEKATDGMRMTNADGIVLMANEAYCKIMQKRRKEIEGKPISIVYETAKHAAVLRSHQERFKTRSIPAHLERELVMWNGKRIFLDLSNSFMEIENGETVSLSIMRDSTERKQAEEALLENEAKYRTLVTKSPDGVFIADLKGNFLSVNQAMCKDLKYTEEDFLSMQLWDIVPQQYESLHQKRLQALINGESKQDAAAYEVQAKDGSVRFIEVQSAPYYKDKKLIGFQGIARDITERKWAEEELQQQLNELQEWYNISMNREGRIIELKKDINSLLKSVGKKEKYELG